MEILAVDLQEEPKQVKAFASREGMAFPVLADEDGAVARKYGIYAIPTTFILDNRGVIKEIVQGSTTEDALLAKIEPMLAK